MVEVVICATHLILDPAEVIEKRLQQERALTLRCRVSHGQLLVSYGLNVILLAFCTVYAFKTRYLPDNFNETKFIAFSCYATAIAWIAFVLVYFGNNNNTFLQVRKTNRMIR